MKITIETLPSDASLTDAHKAIISALARVNDLLSVDERLDKAISKTYYKVLAWDKTVKEEEEGDCNVNE